MSEPNEATLDELRTEIDAVDEQIITLLARRTTVVTKIGVLKRRLGASEDGVRALDRVEGVVRRIRKLADAEGMDPMIAERTYRALIAALTEMQLELPDEVRR